MGDTSHGKTRITVCCFSVQKKGERGLARVSSFAGHVKTKNNLSNFHEENDSTARMPSKANTAFKSNVAGVLSVALEDFLVLVLAGVAVPVALGVVRSG
jgi:hypothetical protein